jgi:hypothetical protein
LLHRRESHPRPATALFVRIARIGHCSDLRDVVLEVLPGGGLKLNGENQTREDLARRLEDIFKSRYYRYAFVKGDPNVSFGEVARAIDIASRQVDYMAIVTPSVARKATYRGGGCLPTRGEEETCLDPNLPSDGLPQ